MRRIVLKALVCKPLTGIFVILLSVDGFESNCIEMKSVLKSNCPEVHWETLDNNF